MAKRFYILLTLNHFKTRKYVPILILNCLLFWMCSFGRNIIVRRNTAYNDDIQFSKQNSVSKR